MEQSALQVDLDDRIFEHGLGLFETLRLWKGHAPVLKRHLGRLQASAEALGIALNDVPLPDISALISLIIANESGPNARIRIVLSGGHSAGLPPRLWVRSGPSALNEAKAIAKIDYGFWNVLESDSLARHKTLNYWSRRLAHQQALERGLVEVLSVGAEGRLWEGSRTNLFVVRESTLLTASCSGPIVPGIHRQVVIESARSLGMSVEEMDGITPRELAESTEVFLTNSVRGIVPVHQCREWTWVGPGLWTSKLAADVASRMDTAMSKGLDL